MAEVEKKDWSKWRDISEEEWRKKCLAEPDDYGRLIAASGYPGNERFRRIMEYVMTPLEAKVCAQIIWFMHPPEELAEMLNLDVDTVNKILHDLYEKGLIHPRNFHTLEDISARYSLFEIQRCLDGTLFQILPLPPGGNAH